MFAPIDVSVAMRRILLTGKVAHSEQSYLLSQPGANVMPASKSQPKGFNLPNNGSKSTMMVGNVTFTAQ